MAITRREALHFCKNVLKINERVITSPDKNVFFNSYAENFTKRVPFTSAFDNHVMESRGHHWNDMMQDFSLLRKPGRLWFDGILQDKFGSSCQVAATFTKLLFESLDVKCASVLSLVHLFPLPIVHALVVAEDSTGQKSVIDLGNRLTPLPLSISMELDIGSKSPVFEAGDTYTYLTRTGQNSFERWIGYELNEMDGTIKDAKLFCNFSLDDEITFFDSETGDIDMNPLINNIIKWKIQADVVMNYWTYNVPISGFSHKDDRIVRVTNRTFDVQAEPKIGANFETFKAKSFDDYCKNVFEHFPKFENDEFVTTMSAFWKKKYSSK